MRFRLPCLIFTGINEEGKTVIFGLCLLQSENYENFRWGFDRFRLFTKINGKSCMPKVIITDEDNTMISAIGDIFPESIHQICSWHKSQNFKKHLLSITKTIGKSKELSEEKKRE